MSKLLWLLRGPAASGKTTWAADRQERIESCAILSQYSTSAVFFAFAHADEVIVDENVDPQTEILARGTFEKLGVQVQVQQFPIV